MSEDGNRGYVVIEQALERPAEVHTIDAEEKKR